MNKRDPLEYVAFGVIILSIFGVFMSLASLFGYTFSFSESENSKNSLSETSVSSSLKTNHFSSMTFTAYDKKLAKQFMDQNGDGKCDSCGMAIDMCIDSGMMQCSMDRNAKIGILGSQHIHADWKIYIDGKPFDWLPYGDLHERQMQGDSSIKGTSAFIHIHPAVLPEKTGDVLHMHAEGVPLWIFFESIGLELPEGMTVYVNGEEIADYKNYVFSDLDKILITDGIGDVEEQLNSITEYAQNH